MYLFYPTRVASPRRDGEQDLHLMITASITNW
jgi:hypothetical protein